VADSNFAVPDPALAVTTLHAAGLDAHRLDAAGREQLAGRLSGRRLAHPVLVSYAATGRGRNLTIPDFDDSIHENVLLSAGVLSLWAIDLRAGELVRGVDHYFELRRETGWFGIEDKRSPALQLAAAIDELWRSFIAGQEDS
jgi:hypothetical protein